MPYKLNNYYHATNQELPYEAPIGSAAVFNDPWFFVKYVQQQSESSTELENG